MIRLVAPATTAQQLETELRVLVESSDHYIDPTGQVFAQLGDKLDILGKADAVSRSLLYAALWMVAGDRAQAEYYIENARRLNADAVRLDVARIITLVNLGYFSEALRVMQRFLRPEAGRTIQLLSEPPSIGSFHILSELAKMAKVMNLANIPSHVQDFHAAAQIMAEWGDSDEDYASALDVAGEILRERHLFFKGSLITTLMHKPADGGSAYVKLAFKVAVDFDTSLDMTCDYAERLSRSGRKIPQSMVFEFEPEEV